MTLVGAGFPRWNRRGVADKPRRLNPEQARSHTFHLQGAAMVSGAHSAGV